MHVHTRLDTQVHMHVRRHLHTHFYMHVQMHVAACSMQFGSRARLIRTTARLNVDSDAPPDDALVVTHLRAESDNIKDALVRLSHGGRYMRHALVRAHTRWYAQHALVHARSCECTHARTRWFSDAHRALATPCHAAQRFRNANRRTPACARGAVHAIVLVVHACNTHARRLCTCQKHRCACMHIRRQAHMHACARTRIAHM